MMVWGRVAATARAIPYSPRQRQCDIKWRRSDGVCAPGVEYGLALEVRWGGQ